MWASNNVRVSRHSNYTSQFPVCMLNCYIIGVFALCCCLQPKNFLCSHAFCGYCIDKWLAKKKECPICRSKVTTAAPNFLLANLIDKAVEQMSEENKLNRSALIVEREGKSLVWHRTNSWVFVLSQVSEYILFHNLRLRCPVLAIWWSHKVLKMEVAQLFSAIAPFNPMLPSCLALADLKLKSISASDEQICMNICSAFW